MNHRSRAPLRSGLFVAAAILATAAAANPADGKSYSGKSVHVGHGTAHVVVRTDAGGRPQSVSVVLSRGALRGLPTRLNKKTPDGAWEYPLPMPAGPVKTGYSEVVVDWNPHGHPPPHIYTVPHFDFHFYMVAPNEVAKIHFSGPADPAAQVLDSAIVPPGYKVIPETAIDKMGVHAIDTSAPEFNGKPFTATFIYGYYRDRLVFLEPMVTRAYLETKPRFSQQVKTPARYSLKGYYPTAYSVRYDAGRHDYVIKLDGLKGVFE